MPQLRNAEIVDVLSADFQLRYEPNFACANAISIGKMLPGLRGFWAMSATASTGEARDMSDQDMHLTYAGNPTYGYQGLAPYITFDGTGDYLSRSDTANLDITGTETIYAPNVRGLTLGGWFYRSAAGVEQGLMSKWNTVLTNQRSYMLYLNASNQILFSISTDGTTVVSVTHTETIATNQWTFIAGRFKPGSELKIWKNLTARTNTTGIPASIFNSTANFNVGAYANGSLGLFTGRASLCFLSAMYLNDYFITNFYHQTRALFGK